MGKTKFILEDRNVIGYWVKDWDGFTYELSSDPLEAISFKTELEAHKFLYKIDEENLIVKEYIY